MAAQLGKKYRCRKPRCQSCKRLKIGCDGESPRCEYCRYTDRECVYDTASELPDVKRQREKMLRGERLQRIEEREEQVVGRLRHVNAADRAPRLPVSGPPSSLGGSCVSTSASDSDYAGDVACDNGDGATSSMSPSPDLRLWASQYTLNEPFKHMKVSRFQYRLLKYFHQGLILRTIKEPPLRAMWSLEVPSLFRLSELMKNSMYSLSTMSLLHKCDLATWVDPTNVVIDTSFFPEPVPNIVEFRLNLHLAVRLYYQRTLEETFTIMDKVACKKMTVSTVEQAAEIFLSGSLLYMFLALQADNIVPLRHEDPRQPDLISMGHGKRESMELCCPLLRKSQYSALFLKNILSFPENERDFPFVQTLRSYAEAMHESGELATTKLAYYREALDSLSQIIASAVARQSGYVIYKWLFLLSEPVYGYLRVDRDRFANKLLFAFCCLNILSGFYLKRKQNVWMEYIEWYRHQREDRWEDGFDERLDKLIRTGFSFASSNFKVLHTFQP